MGRHELTQPTQPTTNATMSSNFVMIAFTQLPFSQSKPCHACRCGSITHKSTTHHDCPLRRTIPTHYEYETILQPNFLTERIKKLFVKDQIVYQNEGEMLLLGDMLVKKTKGQLKPTKKLVYCCCSLASCLDLSFSNNRKIWPGALRDEYQENFAWRLADAVAKMSTDKLDELENCETFKYNAKTLIKILNASYIKANKLLERFKPFFTRKVAEHIQREMRMAQYAYIPANLHT